MMPLLMFLAWSMMTQAWACEPVHLKFEGTAFARRSVQIENDRVFFFRGLDHEIVFTYRSAKKSWCYEEKSAHDSRPQTGCLQVQRVDGKQAVLIDRKPVPNFLLRDHRKKAVASIRAGGKTLVANFLRPDGAALGKRMVFTSVTKGVTESVEVRGWNCPNPRFLSCVGAEVVPVVESEAGAGPRLPIIDLAKNLGHYRFSCNGLTEHTADGETKKALSPTEP